MESLLPPVDTVIECCEISEIRKLALLIDLRAFPHDYKQMPRWPVPVATLKFVPLC